MRLRTHSGTARSDGFQWGACGAGRRRGMVAFGVLALIGFAWSVLSLSAKAATPPSQPVTVPASGTATYHWTGTIPALSAHPSSTCAPAPHDPTLDPTLDNEAMNISVPAGLYTSNSSTFSFSITWTPSNPSGAESENDEE